MSLLVSSNDTIKSAVDILESVSKTNQERMLRLLKLEKARIVAKKLDKHQSTGNHSEDDITEAIHHIRKSYGSK